jgi:hypothetical protein
LLWKEKWGFLIPSNQKEEQWNWDRRFDKVVRSARCNRKKALKLFTNYIRSIFTKTEIRTLTLIGML